MTDREEALERVKQWKARDVRGLAEEFAGAYGLKAQPELESSPFAIHDGAHRWSNLPATVYGELLENVVDKSAMDKLYGSGAIHGMPESMRGVQHGDTAPRKASFVNYGRMPDKERFNERAALGVSQGADPSVYAPGGEFSWDREVTNSISAQQKELSGVFGVADDRFKKGDFTFFQDAGEYVPENGFMPSPSLRNTREIAPQDVNAARVRGEAYADAMMEGYRGAVSEGRYKPQRPAVNGLVHAADLADAATGGELRVGRGWADEGIFPYRDKVGALSNPPALLRAAPDDMDWEVERAVRARDARALERVARSVRTGTSAAASVAGSVPLFDPEFRAAVESGDLRKAGTQAAKEVATGVAVSPVVGAAAGVVQRVAPRIAARALPAVATAARIGNPVALVSQLGGSSNQSPRQRAEQRRRDPASSGAQGPSANQQLLRAERARRRGGKWKVGPFTVPELGLSEAGGLFFR